MRNQLSCKNHFNHHLTIWRELFAISKDLRYQGQIINKCFISKIEITSIELNNILIVTIWHTKIRPYTLLVNFKVCLLGCKIAQEYPQSEYEITTVYLTKKSCSVPVFTIFIAQWIFRRLAISSLFKCQIYVQIMSIRNLYQLFSRFERNLSFFRDHFFMNLD